MPDTEALNRKTLLEREHVTPVLCVRPMCCDTHTGVWRGGGKPPPLLTSWNNPAPKAHFFIGF